MSLKEQFKNALVPSKNIKKQPTLKKEYITVYDYVKCYVLLVQHPYWQKYWYTSHHFSPIPGHLIDWYYRVVRPKGICDSEYEYHVQVIPVKYWTKFRKYFKAYIAKRTDHKFKIKIVSIRTCKEVSTDWWLEDTKYYYQDSGFIKVGDKHFIKKSNTDVVYHYYGSNNRTKHNAHIKNKQQYGCRFYKRQLEYNGWFYDLPKDFNIRKDWQTVYQAYLDYLETNQIKTSSKIVGYFTEL